MFTLMFNNRTYSKCIEHSQIKQCRHLILVFSFVVVFDFVIFISRFGRYFCNCFCRMVSNVNCPFNYERRRMSRFFFIPRMIYYLPFEFESIIDLFNILIFKTKIVVCQELFCVKWFIVWDLEFIVIYSLLVTVNLIK